MWRALKTALPCMQDEASTEAYFQQWMGQAGASYAAGSPEYAARLVLFQQSLSSVLQVSPGGLAAGIAW